MKTKSKALLLTLCAVLLVAASVMGTMAYLTSTDKVENTFTVGSVAITLDEAKTNPDGSLVEGAARVDSNSYKLLPGHAYSKDPTVHVDAASEDCYLFVTIDNGIADIEKTGDTTVAAQMAAKGWKLVEGKTTVYVYVGTNTAPTAVSKNADIPIFEKIVIDGDNVDNETLEDYATAKIIVNAYAIQKDGFENESAANIWAKFGVTAD